MLFLGSLSCWKVNPSRKSFLQPLTGFRPALPCIFSFHFPITLTRFTLSAEDRHSPCIMLPPPYFTVKTVCSCQCIMIVECMTNSKVVQTSWLLWIVFRSIKENGMNTNASKDLQLLLQPVLVIVRLFGPGEYTPIFTLATFGPL
ncbi:hypothetical protein CHARACLAT_026728 [Characodon lateralis]|uniref:Uncharacterized protein n=1 Tax=Characodon lateralis TaxID=208331 RepID=A0ABU7F8E9_9TELE|nr:hypothetical protein [Characodon lateralis]